MAVRNKRIPYPYAICHDCGMKYGRRQNYENFIATFYPETCGICKAETTCTEPRDYGHLDSVKCLQDKIRLV